MCKDLWYIRRRDTIFDHHEEMTDSFQPDDKTAWFNLIKILQFNYNLTYLFLCCTQGEHVLVLSIKGSCWLWYRYRVTAHMLNSFFIKTKKKNLYFHLNLLLSSFYGLCSFFFEHKLWTHRSAFYFFVLRKCVLISACYHMYASFYEAKFQNSLGHLNHQPCELTLTAYWLLG